MSKKLNKKEGDYAKLHKIDKRAFLRVKNFYQSLIDDEKTDWISMFEENPYRLVEMEGYGFKRADMLAQKIGYNMESQNRILAYVVYAVELISQGSTIINFIDLLNKVKKDLNLTNNSVLIDTIFNNSKGYLLLNSKCKRISSKDINEGLEIPQYITTKTWFYTEKFVYEWLKNIEKLYKKKKDYNIQERITSKCEYPLSEEQMKIVDGILDKNINLIIGKSGTGKSYSTKKVLDLLDSYGLSYCLLSPTGIASVNILDKTGREAQTIHSRYYSNMSKQGQPSPIEEDYIIIDEVGMCGVDHFKMIKEMIPEKDVKIIFIGDKYQLGSISAGDFLSSIMKLIKNKIVDGNIFELNTIMRASSESFIPYLSNMFCDKSRFDSSIINKKDLKGVSFVKRTDNLKEQLSNIVKDKKWEFENTAIIIPQRVGDFGCNPINDYFHDILKSPILYSDEKGYKKYKKGDTLMHLRNDRMKGIFNGERVDLIDKKDDYTYVLKRIYDGEIFEYNDEEMYSDVGLSYANTIHKLQGLTVEHVIFVCIKPHTFMLNRNIVYTSISRASKEVVIVYDEGMLEYSDRKTITDKRKTFLGLIAEMSKSK